VDPLLLGTSTTALSWTTSSDERRFKLRQAAPASAHGIEGGGDDDLAAAVSSPAGDPAWSRVHRRK